MTTKSKQTNQRYNK